MVVGGVVGAVLVVVVHRPSMRYGLLSITSPVTSAEPFAPALFPVLMRGLLLLVVTLLPPIHPLCSLTPDA